MNQTIRILKSEQDRSINFIAPTGQESRYVRRTNDAAIVYLSSHNGCTQACRFCHLTQTKQTDFVDTRSWEFFDQAQHVLTHYRHQVREGLEPPAKVLHFNWMARGEPFLNKDLLKKWNYIRETLHGFGVLAGVQHTKFKVSTILPERDDVFWFEGRNLPEIYYSLYSVNPEFRKRWLPNASTPQSAAKRLRYHLSSGGRLVFHWAFIKGENDSDEDVEELMKFIIDNDLVNAKLNIVRYNPFSDQQGQESDEATIEKHFKTISSILKQPGSRIVPRVGIDIAASCGMFVDKSVVPSAKF